MINEIKKYKNLVEAEVTNFQWELEIMYWEWSKPEFAKKYQTSKAICFPIHKWKVVDANRIIWFEVARPELKILHNRISSLDYEHQKGVKMKVKEYEKNNKRYPSVQRLDNVIEYILNPDMETDKGYLEMKESQEIRDTKWAKRYFFNNLSKEEQEKIENETWEKVFKKRPDLNKNKDSIVAKCMFIWIKNMNISKLMDDS